jgi:hypothetical protein
MTKMSPSQLLASLALSLSATAMAVSLTIAVKIVLMADLQVVRPLGQIAARLVNEMQVMLY